MVVEGLYMENKRLKRDMKMLGEELNVYRAKEQEEGSREGVIDGEDVDEDMENEEEQRHG